MKVLILGGNGYLGSKFMHSLLSKNKNCSIICTVRNGSEIKRLEDIKDRIQIISFTNTNIIKLLRTDHIDAVVNFIGDYGRNNNDMLNEKTLEANIELPLKILNLTTIFGIKRFITIGTGLPYNLNMYSFSKAMFGKFGEFYADKYDISFVDIRLEMFYGYDEARTHFIPNVIEKMLLGETVDVTLGTQKRDIIAVEDVIYALEIVLFANLSGYREIPIGTGIAPTISEIIDYIWELTGKKSVVNKGAVPMRPNEPDCIANTSQIRKLCDWQPELWQNGIKRMIKNMEKEI